MLYGVAIFIFVLVCLMLVGIILLQSSQTGGMGTAMGGNAMHAAFGGQGADKLLLRITSGLAVAFMFLAISINMLDNPASTYKYSNESTLSRNKGNTELVVPTDVLPAAEDVAAPVEETKTDTE